MYMYFWLHGEWHVTFIYFTSAKVFALHLETSLLQSSMQSLQGPIRRQHRVCMIALYTASLWEVEKAFLAQEFYAKLTSLSNDRWLEASVVCVHHDALAEIHIHLYRNIKKDRRV